MPEEIRYLGELQRLERKPGDVFVLTCDRKLTREQTENLRAYWRNVMGTAPLLVLEAGLKLGVMSESIEG